MKFAKKMYFTTAGKKSSSRQTLIESFEKEIVKIFNNKHLSSEERIQEYKKIVSKYEHFHLKNKNKNDKMENFNNEIENGMAAVTFQLQDVNRVAEESLPGPNNSNNGGNAHSTVDTNPPLEDFAFAPQREVEPEDSKKKLKTTNLDIKPTPYDFSKFSSDIKTDVKSKLESFVPKNYKKNLKKKNISCKNVKKSFHFMDIEPYLYLYTFIKHTQLQISGSFMGSLSPVQIINYFSKIPNSGI